jgi:hypothetical protein
MDNFQVAKKYLQDIQSVVTEALDNLDKLQQEELTIESVCHALLKKYQGREPSMGDVLTFKTAIELTLHNDYGVSTSQFE